MDKFEKKIWTSKCEKGKYHIWEDMKLTYDGIDYYNGHVCKLCQGLFLEKLNPIIIDDAFKTDFPSNEFVERGVDYYLKKTKKGREMQKEYKWLRNIMTIFGLMIWDKAQKELVSHQQNEGDANGKR